MNTATMSGSAPTKHKAEPADIEASRSESQFLADQADLAKKAMSHAWSELKHGALRMADPHQLTHKHPWGAVGAAAAAGFATAWFTVPTKEDRTIRKLAKIEQALNPRPEKSVCDTDPSKRQTLSQSIFSGLGSEVLKTLRPVILSALTAGITAMSSQSEKSRSQKEPDNDPVVAS